MTMGEMTDAAMHISLITYLVLQTVVGIGMSQRQAGLIFMPIWSVTLLLWEVSRWLR